MFFKKKLKVVTHDGSFHADDVFAVATVSLALGDVEIVRSRDPEIIKQADVLLDLGRVYDPENNKFDHHQEGGAGKRENGVPYASFGLVWKKFGAKLCDNEDEAKKIDGQLVSLIDGEDNGVDLFENKTSVKNYSVYSVIASFNKTTLEKKTDNEMFEIALGFAKEILKREIITAKEFTFGKRIIERAYTESNDKRIVVFEEPLDKEVIYSVLEPKETLYAVYPYHKIGWAVRGIRVSGYSFATKKDLPKEWAGKTREELQKITGVPDAIFCHNGRYLANAVSKEGAIKLAEIAINS